MNNIDFTHHHNQHNAVPACAHCLSINGHESWCATCDPKVQYAYAILAEPRKLTIGDSLILHSLGVSWSDLKR
jgi:hypothetical protein